MINLVSVCLIRSSTAWWWITGWLAWAGKPNYYCSLSWWVLLPLLLLFSHAWMRSSLWRRPHDSTFTSFSTSVTNFVPSRSNIWRGLNLLTSLISSMELRSNFWNKMLLQWPHRVIVFFLVPNAWVIVSCTSFSLMKFSKFPSNGISSHETRFNCRKWLINSETAG